MTDLDKYKLDEKHRLISEILHELDDKREHYVIFSVYLPKEMAKHDHEREGKSHDTQYWMDSAKRKGKYVLAESKRHTYSTGGAIITRLDLIDLESKIIVPILTEGVTTIISYDLDVEDQKIICKYKHARHSMPISACYTEYETVIPKMILD